MPINSKQKGKRGELEACKALETILNISHMRSVQYCGRAGDADIVGLKGVHFEVKRLEKMNLYEALSQAIDDAKNDEVPVVMHRKNKKDWVLVLKAENMVDFARAVCKAVDEVAEQNSPKLSSTE